MGKKTFFVNEGEISRVLFKHWQQKNTVRGSYKQHQMYRFYDESVIQSYSFLDYSSIAVAYLEPYQASMMKHFF